MAIPNVSRERLIAALDQFDHEFRDAPEFHDWTMNAAYRYAIRHENRLYPVKKVVAIATGVPLESFSGGQEANSYVQERGFSVTTLGNIPANPIKEALDAILSQYREARLQPFGSSNEVVSVLHGLVPTLKTIRPVAERPTITVRASAGIGNWAAVPWLALLDSRETSSTREGVYAVFLFRTDMSGVYLAFAQGVTVLRKMLGTAGAREQLQKRATELRSYCPELPSRGFNVDGNIDLRAKAGLGAEYEDSTIAYKLYDQGNVPTDETIIDDIAAVLGAYDKYLSNKESTPGNGTGSSTGPVLNLANVVNNFSKSLIESGLSFGPAHNTVVRSFIASLATKRFAILTGLSGSGKTQIALRFGDWLGKDRSKIIAVRPDWTGSEALFGYEDALLPPATDGRRFWSAPAALQFMLKAANDPGSPYLLILDEMNLAHVERYFADMLSGMESGWECLPNLVSHEGYWRIDPNGAELIPFPANLFVIGTVNVDETTYLFSPKVLDRANTFEFRVSTADLSAEASRPSPCRTGPMDLIRVFLTVATDDRWQLTHRPPAADLFEDNLRRVHALLTDAGLEFGHRVYYEANRFCAVNASAGGEDVLEALDLQIMQKVLPRLHGSRRRLEAPLSALLRFCLDLSYEVGSGTPGGPVKIGAVAEGIGPRLPISHDKASRMLRSLRANQFTSFTE